MYLTTVLNSALLLLLRSFRAALLMVVGMKFFLAYIAGDMCCTVAQKLLRGDFLYWLPIAALVSSLLMRIVS